jgi:hypothetical protein
VPGYVTKALDRFQHNACGRAQHSSHAWTKPQYGSHPQLTPAPDDTDLLPPSTLTRIQEIVRTLLFYGRAIDSTMLVTLGTIASQQSKGTQATAQALTQLLNYAAAHPDATVRYHASDMYLHVHIDASYLSEASARSRVGGIFFLNQCPTDPSKPPAPTAIPASPLPKMVPSKSSAPSCATSWNLPWKPNSEHSSTMHEMEYHSAPLSSKWATIRQQRRFRQTMRVPPASPTKL